MAPKKIPFAPLLEMWITAGGTRASLARDLGITQATITNWSARKAIPLSALYRVAPLLNMTPDEYLAKVGLGPVAVSQPLAADIQKIIKEWPLLMPTEQKAILDEIVSKAEYNRAVHNQLGKLPKHADDGRVAAAYNQAKTKK